MIQTKQCSLCNEELGIENFYKNKGNKDGLHSYCKECAKKKARKWSKDNYEKNRDTKVQNERERRKIPSVKAYYRKNSKKQRESGYFKSWQDNNKDKIANYREDRYMHKTHEISKAEWDSCKSYFDNSCAYCGTHISEHFNNYKGEQKWSDFHKEHVDHNGSNDISNCVPSCKSCNSKKWIYSIEEWYTLTNEVFCQERFDKITSWLTVDYLKTKENFEPNLAQVN